MNGYFQIPIPKIRIKNDALSLKINGRAFKYRPKNKRIINLIYKLQIEPKISDYIGFMIKDNKIISHESIDLIEKRAGIKFTASKNNFSKPKIINFPFNKIRFYKDYIKLTIDGKKTNIKIIGVKKEFNQLKCLKSFVNRHVKLEYSEGVIKVDKNEINKLIKDLVSVLNRRNNLNLLGVKSREGEVTKLIREKRNLLEEYGKINKKKKNKKKKKKPVVYIKSRIEKPEKTNFKKTYPSLTKPLNSSFSGEIKNDDWNILTFNNKFINYTHQNIDYRILEKRSSYYLNWIKEIFVEKKYTFTVIFVEGKPTKIIFYEDVFEEIELSKIIFAHENFEYLGNNIKAFLDIKRLGISFERIFSLFKISKKYYIEYLCKLHSNTEKLIVILEPIFQYKEFIRNDLSFLFIHENGENLVAIWESTYYDKATYLFYQDSIVVPSKKEFLAYLSDFLCKQEPRKRYNLRSKNYTIKGVKNYKSINHRYLSSEDNHWKYTINNNLLNH